ncbi:RnfABCDGE type electron transport complex subunit A [Lentisphaerota bacterium WC36G]|nr:RnfABCDGE type electron transport complex subunit A [Lentisphaerae bacterium WC36]
MNEELAKYMQITIGIVLVNNIVLAQFLGICPFLGVSKKLKTALGMCGAVIFVMTLASLVTSAISKYVLSKTFIYENSQINFKFLQILVFIVVIASLVQLVEISLKKLSPSLYGALGIYLPLITTNCAVMGIAVNNVDLHLSVFQSTIHGFFGGISFSLALILFSSLREKLDLANIPKPFQGTAIALITGGLLAMAFQGFSGLV